MTLNGGISAKLRLKKPIAVVSEVRNTGHALISRECAAARLRSIPCRRPAAIPSMTWTECATVTAIRTKSAAALSPNSFMPVQPVNPSAESMTAIIIRRIATVPHIERSRMTATSSIVPSAMGARMAVSSLIASRMARLRTSSPVRW